MECKKINKNDFYSITWSIKNFSYSWQKRKKSIVSPTFSVYVPEVTKWKLMVCPRGCLDGNYIALYLYRDRNCNFVGNIEVEYSFEILGSGGSALVSANSTNKFGKDRRMGFPRYIIRKTVIMTGKVAYLPQDILTLRCRMKRIEDKTIQIQQIIAQTIINVERISFVWRIEQFSQMTPDDIKSFVIKSGSNSHLVKMNLSLTNEKDSEEKINLSICSFERYLKYALIKTFILNSKEQKVDSGEFECLFEDGKRLNYQMKILPKMILENRSLYLPGEILSLNFVIATSGISSGGLETVEFDYTSHQTTNEIVVNWRNFNDEESASDDFSELKTDLMSLYEDHPLSDMKLKTKTSTFPVHISILGARSPVFRAMFSSDMKEKVNGCVDVSDLPDETVRRFLLYLYTDQLEHLEWDGALQLYKAADKYAVISLRDKCSSFLKSILNLENACEILLLSDFHQDKDLKEVAQAFILQNAKIIFKSEEWKHFGEANSKLAMETMLRHWNEE